MNELQQTELDILKHFLSVCRQLDLRYYLVCGTCLGAVKYEGFIPWDDDVDVGMPREDYEIFIREAPAYLPEHLFLQNYHSDPAFPQMYSKLRNSNTAYIEKTVAHLPIHHGVYIDIFPLDGYPSGKLASRLLGLRKRVHLLKISCVYRYENRSAKGKLLYRIGKILGWDRNTQRAVERYDRMLSRWPLDASELWCNHGNWQGRLEYAPAWHYGEGIPARFEGLDVRIPASYREYLTQKYGDYSLDPPLQDQQGHHYYLVCDCEKSFHEYIHD